MKWSLGIGLAALLSGCLGGQGGQASPAGSTTPSAVSRDSSRLLVPAGYGSLKQEDVAIRIARRGLQLQAIPLDETIIRVLSPDSYRALRELVASRRVSLDSLARRTGLGRFSVWLVRFHGLEQGETPFSPMEFIVTSVGRDFRPIDVLPVTPGFGQQRLRQREVQQALYVFDPQVDVNQPLTVQYESTRNTEWGTILTRIERERVLVRSRAGSNRDGRWEMGDGRRTSLCLARIPHLTSHVYVSSEDPQHVLDRAGIAGMEDLHGLP